MLNANGFSLVEVMIASAVVVTAAVMLSSNSSLYVSQGYNMRRACDAHAQSVIGAVQEETYYRQIQDTIVVGGVRTPVNAFTATRAVPTVNWYWETNGAADPVYDVTTSGAPGVAPALHSGFLIQGSLRSLGAIYNNHAAVRCTFGVYNPLTVNLPVSQSLGSANPNVTIMLEPYDASTGLSLCATAPTAIYPVPRSQRPGDADTDVFATSSGVYAAPEDSKDGTDSSALIYPTGSGQETMIAKRALGATPDLGIRMTVQVNYTFKDQPSTCVASQKFEYPSDRDPPPKPNLIDVRNNTSISATAGVVRDVCTGAVANPNGSVDIDIGYDNVFSEGGVQFLCMDQSWIRKPDAMSMQQCMDTSGNPLVAYLLPQNSAPSPDYFATNGYPYPYTPDFTLRAQGWQPCDLMIQCGVSPASTAVNPASPNLSLTNHYDGLPPGCVLNFEVVAIDTSGNRSGSKSSIPSKVYLEGAPDGAASPTGAGAPQNLSSLGLGAPFVEYNAFEDEIYYPSCTGTPNPTYYQGGLGNKCPGYYKCDGGC